MRVTKNTLLFDMPILVKWFDQKDIYKEIALASRLAQRHNTNKPRADFSPCLSPSFVVFFSTIHYTKSIFSNGVNQ